MDKPIISKTKNTFPFQYWTVKEAPIADRIKQPIYIVSSQIFSKKLFDLCRIYSYTIYILPMPPRMLELLNLSAHVVSISRVRVLRHFRIRVAVWNIKIWTIISTNIYPCWYSFHYNHIFKYFINTCWCWGWLCSKCWVHYMQVQLRGWTLIPGYWAQAWHGNGFCCKK